MDTLYFLRSKRTGSLRESLRQEMWYKYKLHVYVYINLRSLLIYLVHVVHFVVFAGREVVQWFGSARVGAWSGKAETTRGGEKNQGGYEEAETWGKEEEEGGAQTSWNRTEGEDPQKLERQGSGVERQQLDITMLKLFPFSSLRYFNVLFLDLRRISFHVLIRLTKI